MCDFILSLYLTFVNNKVKVKEVPAPISAYSKERLKGAFLNIKKRYTLTATKSIKNKW